MSRTKSSNEFNRHLKLAKEKNDIMALAFALEELSNPEDKRKLDDFRKDRTYKKLLEKSLKRSQELVKSKDKITASIDNQYYLECKRRLKLLEKEAKNLKIKI